MKRSIANFLAFQAGWFACILSAAAGVPWFGVAFVAAWVGVHIAASGNFKGELLIALLAGVVGYFADSLLIVSNVMAIPAEAQLGRPSTIWLIAMWVNFAATLNVSLRWLQSRLTLAAAFGAIGGPLAYYAGMKFGAVEFPQGVTPAVIASGLEWAIATPVLVLIARRFGSERTSCEQEVDDNAADAQAGVQHNAISEGGAS